ncbi:O-antigen polymerase [Flavobacterium sp. ASV13]|uniref:O-antigen polymerase n=1 Tax=Flavobacterium sp. ASV13 TaxID=1506583 RepID=UPI00054F35D0|nr:O-antigen polymerase [Flavobacterium sp. ASV13]
MKTSSAIYQKLEGFIKKYYMNELIKGGLLFIGFGLLYFLFTLFIEYFLWLKPLGRTLLFWIFIGVEVFLLFRFILFPIFKLFKLQKGIDYNQASAIIGNHFTEVSDKLTNFLQLSSNENSAESSELMLASIEQKANSLQPIPFGNAINYKSNKKYLPLALIPVLLFAVFFVSGNSNIISQSFNRVVHFNASFLPPAPFKFVVLNDNLQTEQNKDFIVKVETEGKVVPENVMIHIGNESYFMESSQTGKFEFKIEKPTSDVQFSLEGNSVSSNEYELKVITVPSIANFEMVLNFPSYLKKKSETIQGTGNAIVPEGTSVTWKMSTKSTQEIVWKDENSASKFNKIEDEFKLSKSINQNTEYQILTSNNKVKNYEKLDYQLSVIKDQHPTISVSPAPDSLKLDKNYVLGRLGDDYGLSKLQVVYYEKNKLQTAKRGTIPVKQAVFDQFVFNFPSNLPVEEGVSYEYYFEVFDNDAPHGFKSTKSSTFSDRVATTDEIHDAELQQQNANINSLSKSLKNQEKQFSEMDKLKNTGKEKDNLEFKDQQKVNDFIKRQKQQDELMKQFTEKMNKNLDKYSAEKKDKTAEDLQKRLDNAEKDLEKNQKLLDELKNLNDKLNSDELFDKMEKFKQISKNQSRNLEQLVELTKRFYVEKKAGQVAEKLNKLSEQQEQLSDKDKENTKEKQDEINKTFDKIQEDLKDLKEENNTLKSPLDIPKDASKEKDVENDLNKASEELSKKNTSSAKPKQKSASKKMKSMAQQMESNMEAGDQEQLEEDVAMLRQILDNLLAFSLSQEDVMKQFKSMKLGSSAYTKNIKIQQNLKQQFRHVDDSLFAMSLRNPKIAEDVTKEIGNVQYNMDKAIEVLTDVQIPKGVSHQQYAVSSANKLADFLSDLLNNMQMSMANPGAGKPKPGDGQGMQLPDIIQKQKGLADKMKEGMKPGDKQGSGQQGKSGESKPSQDGQQGKDGNGKDGKNGQGKNGQGGKEGGKGKDGNEGEDGEGDAEKIMEIYKEQVKLREALQNELAKKGLDAQGRSAIEQMKASEKQILNKGFKNENLQRILNIQQELLKLNNAVQQQGQDTKRQSETNKTEFPNRSNALPSSLTDYLNSVEILNRQSLPLRSNFNQKVQEYFNTK